ncbi:MULTISPECIES: hypothetical protein [Streptomyces]|nr:MULTISPECIES: hypothetical protein [Streptomyces]MDT9700174.1 hypothetical protein [Streptomyces sp. P17]
MLVEILQGVAFGLAFSLAVSIPAVAWAYFYKCPHRRKKAQ